MQPVKYPLPIAATFQCFMAKTQHTIPVQTITIILLGLASAQRPTTVISPYPLPAVMMYLPCSIKTVTAFQTTPITAPELEAATTAIPTPAIPILQTMAKPYTTPCTLDIQIQDSGTVETLCGQEGVAIGLGYNSYDIVSHITIQDCDSVVADGSYYGTGIGAARECYGGNTHLFETASTVTILRCKNGVTAMGGRYGAAIGSGGNFRSMASVTVDIQDSGTVSATQYKLVEDSTIRTPTPPSVDMVPPSVPAGATEQMRK